jgi:tRNA(Ile)-lysidine synthase
MAVGVSGGADSLCLTLLLHELAMRDGWHLTALTVNHGLRPESPAEAEQVQQWLRQRGINHHILHWEGEKPTANIHQIAREHRYILLTQWCKDNAVPTLAVAHHRDDVAETFLIRLGRGSGVKGLAAMAATQERHGVTLIRPLLSVPPERLRATLQMRYQQPWLEDSANHNPRFTRTHMRALLPILAQYGISAERIVEAAHNLRRAQDAFDTLVIAHINACVLEQSPTRLTLQHAAFFNAPDEIIYRSMAACLQRVNPQPHAPRFASLQKLIASVQNPAPTRRTLHHCRIISTGQTLSITQNNSHTL